jgi:predicted transposase YdaD
MDPWDQPRVKLACLRMLAQLQLDPARRALVSGFVDSYLRLTMDQESEFARELSQIASQEQESVMEIVTSWMEKGLEKGLEKERRLVLRQLRKRLGALDTGAAGRVETLSAEQLEELGEALLEFERLEDLTAWLAANVPQDLPNRARRDGT